MRAQRAAPELNVKHVIWPGLGNAVMWSPETPDLRSEGRISSSSHSVSPSSLHPVTLCSSSLFLWVWVFPAVTLCVSRSVCNITSAIWSMLWSKGNTLAACHRIFILSWCTLFWLTLTPVCQAIGYEWITGRMHLLKLAWQDPLQ